MMSALYVTNLQTSIFIMLLLAHGDSQQIKYVSLLGNVLIFTPLHLNDAWFVEKLHILILRYLGYPDDRSNT